MGTTKAPSERCLGLARLIPAILLCAALPVLAQEGASHPTPKTVFSDDWKVVARPGQFGRRRDALIAGWNEQYGEGNWQIAYEVDGRLFTREAVLMLYEDAYFFWLMEHPEELDWLCSTASDIYDNHPGNVASGLDYAAQETDSNHIQDIAIRRALVRLGRWFEGDHLVEIRGSRSEGAHLSPGRIPFHRPDWIRQPRLEGWWEAGSVEDFYQSNKLIVARAPGAQE